MAAELHGGALHAFGSKPSEMLAHRNRAGEGDLTHLVLGDEMLGNLRWYAEYQIEHASVQAGIGKATHHFDASARRLVRRLEDERTASGKRAANFARGSERREIPRRERGDNSDRFLHHDLAHAFAAAGHDAAVSAASFLGVPFDDVGRGD